MASSWVICGGVAAAVLSVCALMLIVLPRRARGGGQRGSGWSVGVVERDVRGADVAAAGQRREALHVHAEQPRERAGLGLAQRGELVGDVLHRAVALAELHGHAARDRARGGGVPVGGEPVGQRADALGDVVPGGGDRRGVPLLQVADALLREALHGLRPGGLGEEAQRLAGELGVAVRERGLAAAADDVPAGGTPATLRARSGPLVHGDLVRGLEDAEVPTDPGGREVELRGELGGGDRAGGGDDLQHALAGPGVGVRRGGVRQGAVDRRQRRVHAHLRRVWSGLSGRARCAQEGPRYWQHPCCQYPSLQARRPFAGVASLTPERGLGRPRLPSRARLPRARDLRARQALRRPCRRRRARPRRPPRPGDRGPRPQRRRQDDHDRVLRGPAGARRRHRARARPRPGDAGPRPAPARRRDAAGRRPADGRPGARDARARRPDVRRPAGRGRAHRAPRPRLVRRAPPSGGSPGASGSGSRSPRRSSAGPRSCSSTSPAPGWTRRPGTRSGTWCASCATRASPSCSPRT